MIRVLITVTWLAATLAEARWYDSETGTWLSRDDIGAASYLESPNELNPWQYAAGNPTRLVDSDGREAGGYIPNPFAVAEFKFMQFMQSMGVGGTPVCDGAAGASFGTRCAYGSPQGGLSGFWGGALVTSTFRTIPVERNASSLNLFMMETGASQVPLIDSGQRLFRGSTVSGRPIPWRDPEGGLLGGFFGERTVAGFEFASTAVPATGEVTLAGLSTRPGRTLALSAYLRTAPVSLASTEIARTEMSVALSGAEVLSRSRLVSQAGGAARKRGAASVAKFSRFTQTPLDVIQQRADNWCGAACGEMVARRLGRSVPQEQIAASRLFTPMVAVEGYVIEAGGFQGPALAQALEEEAQVANRTWAFSVYANESDHLIAGLRAELARTESSVIVRIRGGNHWIVVDEIDPSGNLLVRNPSMSTSEVWSSQTFRGSGPTGEAVVSEPRQ